MNVYEVRRTAPDGSTHKLYNNGHFYYNNSSLEAWVNWFFGAVVKIFNDKDEAISLADQYDGAYVYTIDYEGVGVMETIQLNKKELCGLLAYILAKLPQVCSECQFGDAQTCKYRQINREKCPLLAVYDNALVIGMNIYGFNVANAQNGKDWEE